MKWIRESARIAVTIGFVDFSDHLHDVTIVHEVLSQTAANDAYELNATNISDVASTIQGHPAREYEL